MFSKQYRCQYQVKLPERHDQANAADAKEADQQRSLVLVQIRFLQSAFMLAQDKLYQGNDLLPKLCKLCNFFYIYGESFTNKNLMFQIFYLDKKTKFERHFEISERLYVYCLVTDLCR